MKIVFMGTPDFAVPALKALADAGYDISAAVTQPDRPKGRGGAVSMSPVKEEALSLGIPILQPHKASEPEFVDNIRRIGPDVIVVAAFGQILPKAVLDIPKYGCINIHGSLLPKYRGAAPVQRAVINGDRTTGLTTMLMNEGLDTGDILETREIAVDDKETSGSLFDKLGAISGELICSTLEGISKGTLKPVKQDDSESSYAARLDKEDGNIDWSRDAVSIERLVRGLDPWPSAYTYLDGRTLKIWEADALPEKEMTGYAPGTLKVTDNGLEAATGSGTLVIKELQLEGKKRMDTASFLRGYHIGDGTVLKYTSKE